MGKLGHVKATRQDPSHESLHVDFELTSRVDAFARSIVLSQVLDDAHVSQDLAYFCLVDVAAKC
jgi:hypothetical protein